MQLQTLSAISAILGLIGGIILAYSLNQVIDKLKDSLDHLSVSIESIASQGDIYVFTGLDKNIEAANRISQYWVRTGLAFLVASVIIAIYVLYATPAKI